MTLVESITQELRCLPNAKLVEVARFVSELAPRAAAKQHAALADSFGAMDDPQGEIFEKLVLKRQDGEPQSDS